MNQTISSGKIFLESDGEEFRISKKDGSSYELLITTTLEYFNFLQFIAACLGYDAYRISRGGTLNTNFVRISRTVEDMYEIGIALTNITLSKTDTSDLMKCIEVSSEWDNDKIALKYGLKKDNRPTVRTIREGKQFSGYSPNIIKNNFGISIEDNAEVRIYLLTNIGDWADIFTLHCVNDIDHIKQAFCMVKEGMECSQPVYISSHDNVFDYDPEHDLSVKVRIGSDVHWFDEEDISDLIRIISIVN